MLLICIYVNNIKKNHLILLRTHTLRKKYPLIHMQTDKAVLSMKNTISEHL